MKRLIASAIIYILAAATGRLTAVDLSSGPLNRPYSDGRAWHAGFYVGVNAQDLRFTHSGFITESGESWFADQPGYSPGFNVGGLIDFRLNDYFNVRLSPGLYFGSRDIKMREAETGETLRQNIKSALLVMPVDLKFSSVRYRNSRPYLTAGVMPAFDVAKKRTDYLKLNTFDCYLTAGFGCDFYLPFFKLNPEIKFCFGLSDVLVHKRPDLAEEPDRLKITQSLKRATSKMIVLSFYFE
ncbi:MAG: PorT family protein [Muribaculaceae bacterium]|nr:PorT family protein [Muribaculaceae bacterium]